MPIRERGPVLQPRPLPASLVRRGICVAGHILNADHKLAYLRRSAALSPPTLPALHRMTPTTRKRRHPPTTFDELVRAGGPEALAQLAAHLAAQEAAQEERRFWLDLLKRMQPDETWPMTSAAIYQGYVQQLRRRLGIPVPKDEVRAQTRSRARRFRERQKK